MINPWREASTTVVVRFSALQNFNFCASKTNQTNPYFAETEDEYPKDYGKVWVSLFDLPVDHFWALSKIHLDWAGKDESAGKESRQKFLHAVP